MKNLNIEVGASSSEDLVFTPNVTGLYDEDISVRNNSPNEQQIINVIADVFSPNYLRIVDEDVFKGETSSVLLNLVNNDAVRAIQFDIEFPDGFILDSDNIIESSLLDDFTVSTSLVFKFLHNTGSLLSQLSMLLYILFKKYKIFYFD